jgi:hypothetical protein
MGDSSAAVGGVLLPRSIAIVEFNFMRKSEALIKFGFDRLTGYVVSANFDLSQRGKFKPRYSNIQIKLTVD